MDLNPDHNALAWFRYTDSLVHCGGCDINGEPLPGSEVRLYLVKYKVDRETPRGVWLRDSCSVNGGPRSGFRFVLRDARKRFACPTREEALASFIARKERQAGIHQARARRADEAADIARRMLAKGRFESGLGRRSL